MKDYEQNKKGFQNDISRLLIGWNYPDRVTTRVRHLAASIWNSIKEHFESEDHKRNEKKLKIKMKENCEKKCDNRDCLNINMDRNLPDNHFFFQVSYYHDFHPVSGKNNCKII